MTKGLPMESVVILPTYQELLALEKIARKEGSGIKTQSLIGLWKLSSVWGKAKEQEDFISGFLLRLISASLELHDSQNKDLKNKQLSIENSVQIGKFKISFKGKAELKGTQPILSFFFDSFELKYASNILLSRSIDIPDYKNRPFFALVSIAIDRVWLSARGRGGGLALWIKVN